MTADGRRAAEQSEERKWDCACICVYIRMQEDKQNPSKKAFLTPAALRRLEQRYRLLKEQLLELGWIAQGSVMPQLPRAWRLTRKVKAKTVSIALSKQQVPLYRAAIADHRKVEAIVHQMRQISDRVLQQSVPGIRSAAEKIIQKPPYFSAILGSV